MILNGKVERDKEIERLIDTYGNDVLRIAFMYLKDKSLAEDCFQDVFIKVYNKYHSFRNESSEKTWIIRITINACKDMIKSSWNKKVIHFEDEVLNQVEDDYSVEEKILDKALFEEVLKLPEKYKDVIILYYYQGFETKEIASILKTTTGNVSSLLSRARNILKESLES